ncbi:GNAT family N-acetyltransferase [Nocardia miyunensis]|uniref:GNAT family N-acetyltransferase n=1 Tax=Nocardia miyunensis TaxID=282684 RepID=UPI00082AA91F|nr:GNAT family N-acetyltransferase [Nocardia miyunensis]
MTISVRPAIASDVPELARVLGAAFADDPIISWLVPDSRVRPRRAGYMFAAMVRHQFLPGGGVDVAFDETGRMLGTAVWAPPGGWQTSGPAQLRMLPGVVRAFRGRMRVAGEMADRMAQHHPAEPHWYLAFIGTHPDARGRGFGHALLAPRLAHCDETACPAYLESSKQENIAYYERFGYDLTGELNITDGGPPMWPMWRSPR